MPPRITQQSQFANAQRQRKKVEALFAELKNQIGLRRLRLRRLKFVREQFFLAAAAQNLKRLVRFLSRHTSPVLAATIEAERSSSRNRKRGPKKIAFHSASGRVYRKPSVK
jgi:hypothetical protein